MSKDRLATFTDAVLAIIMTILVLDLEVPEPLSLEGFWAMRENYFAYTISFFWLGAMWVNLHNEWDQVEKISRKTVWATLIMLFFSSVFPYSTSIVATDFSNSFAQVFYGIIVLLVTFSNMATYHTLIKPNSNNPTFIARMNHRGHWASYDIVLKVLGLLLAVTVFPPAMIFAVVLTLLVFVIPNQLKEPE